MNGTNGATSPSDLVAQVLAGNVRAGATLMRALDVEDEEARARAVDAMRLLYPQTGRAFVIGITGSPGAGKSTLVDELIAAWRATGVKVAVVAVDPSSPFSGGAILGDRVRMQRHALDPGVFIRSLATHGSLGGLSWSTGDIVNVCDALGFGVVFIETVGVGQGEIDVVRFADTTVVVTIPGLGDGIQALKAGVFEVADVIVVNKADRPGVDATVRDLATMLELREAGTDAGETVRQPIEIVRTVAARGEGTATLVAAIEAHRLRQQAGGRFADRRRDHARARVAGILSERWRRRTRAILDADSAGQVAAGLVDDVAARRLDPYSAADRLDGPGVGAVSRT